MRSSAYKLQRLAVVLALIGMAGASQATVTVFTSKAAFDAAAAALTTATDTFEDLDTVDLVTGPLTRDLGNGLSYTADSDSHEFFNGTTATSGIYLSNNSNLDTITFNGFSAGVMGLSGNFFAVNASGAFNSRALTLTATDGSGTITQSFTPATAAGTFLGFLSDGPLTSVTLKITTTGQRWASADNIELAAAVPEPSGYALMLAGLGAIAWVARRRKA